MTLTKLTLVVAVVFWSASLFNIWCMMGHVGVVGQVTLV